MTMGRQVKACMQCRTSKIKCTAVDGSSSCERCLARGLPCNTDKDAQTLLQESSNWQTSMNERVTQLQTAVNVLLRLSQLPALASYSPSSPGSEKPAAATTTAASFPADAENEDDDDAEREVDGVDGDEDDDDAEDAGRHTTAPEPILTPDTIEDNGFYSLPIKSMYEVTKLPSLTNAPSAGWPKSSRTRARRPQDLISRGMMTEAVAQRCFTLFKTRLNYFCYGILCPYDTLEALREASTLLMTAICTVAALHDPELPDAYRVAHAEYQRCVSATMFSSCPTTDDIRTFIVGAYWLGNASYTLLGHAIRTATRLNLHRAYFAVTNPNPPVTATGQSTSGYDTDVANTRLWYTLYILDHHSSIIYGRPAILSPNEEPHQQWELFIRIGGNQEVDLRMSSQVALYHIISKVKDVFGGYAIKPVPEHGVPQLRNFFAELDRWYVTWGDRMPRNAHVGWFPRDGAILHYHFARLHLCSYVFRGMNLDSPASNSPTVVEFASVAVTSATAVLELVLEREDLRLALAGMPLYFLGMITFASVFLIKATRGDFQTLAAIDTHRVFDLVSCTAREMRSRSAARQHLIYHLSDGLEDMVMAAKEASEAIQHDNTLAGDVSRPHDHHNLATMDSMFVMDSFDLLQAPMDQDELVVMPQAPTYPWRDDYPMQQ